MTPLEEATSQRSSPPDKSGTLGGYAWAAWWRELDHKEAGGIYWFVIYDPGGEPVTRWKSVGGRPSRKTKRRGFHPVKDYSLETHAETQILREILGGADYTPLPETIVQWKRAGDVEALLRERVVQGTREGDERRAARMYGCAVEQVREHHVRGVKEADPGTIGV